MTVLRRPTNKRFDLTRFVIVLTAKRGPQVPDSYTPPPVPRHVQQVSDTRKDRGLAKLRKLMVTPEVTN